MQNLVRFGSATMVNFSGMKTSFSGCFPHSFKTVGVPYNWPFIILFQKKDGIFLYLDDALKEANMKQPFELLVKAEVEVMNTIKLLSIHTTMLDF